MAKNRERLGSLQAEHEIELDEIRRPQPGPSATVLAAGMVVRRMTRRNGEPVAYGIDFGTTNSSIAVAYRDRIEVVPVEATGVRDILPSLIYLHRDRNRAAGQDAIEQFLINGSAKTTCSQCELVHNDRRSGTATAASSSRAAGATTRG